LRGTASRPWALPAAAVGDLADLLDIHVDQLTGSVLLVAVAGPLGGADDLPGQRVALGQVGQLVAAQDPRHRPGRHAQLGAQPVLPAASLAAGGHDQRLDLVAGAGRRPAGTRRPVQQTVGAFGGVPGDPAVRALPGHPEFLGDMGDRTAGGDPIDEELATVWGQAGITVGHEDLRLVKT